MIQKLINVINKAHLTVGYKHPWYEKTQGLGVHYGVDVVSENGSRTLYASGDGVVTHCGKDNVLGNVIVIVYPSCRQGYLPLCIRYFHLDSISVKVGDRVDIDKKIGTWGSTGKYVNGAHLHFEVDTDCLNPNYSPTLTSSSNIIKKGTDTTVDPTRYLHLKKTSPENQTVKIKYGGSVAESDVKYNVL